MASRILIVGCARESAELERRGHCLAQVADARTVPFVVRSERGSARGDLCEINVGGARRLLDSSTPARMERTQMRNAPGHVP